MRRRRRRAIACLLIAVLAVGTLFINGVSDARIGAYDVVQSAAWEITDIGDAFGDDWPLAPEASGDDQPLAPEASGDGDRLTLLRAYQRWTEGKLRRFNPALQHLAYNHGVPLAMLWDSLWEYRKLTTEFRDHLRAFADLEGAEVSGLEDMDLVDLMAAARQLGEDAPSGAKASRTEGEAAVHELLGHMNGYGVAMDVLCVLTVLALAFALLGAFVPNRAQGVPMAVTMLGWLILAIAWADMLNGSMAAFGVDAVDTKGFVGCAATFWPVAGMLLGFASALLPMLPMRRRGALARSRAGRSARLAAEDDLFGEETLQGLAAYEDGESARPRRRKGQSLARDVTGGASRAPAGPDWTCPDCGRVNPARAARCPECGEDRPAPRREAPAATNTAGERTEEIPVVTDAGRE